MATKIGTAAVYRAARLEFTVSCAIVIRKKGMTDPTIAMPRMAVQRRRSDKGGRCWRVATITQHSATAPIVNRPEITHSGGRPASAWPLSTAMRVNM